MSLFPYCIPIISYCLYLEPSNYKLSNGPHGTSMKHARLATETLGLAQQLGTVVPCQESWWINRSSPLFFIRGGVSQESWLVKNTHIYIYIIITYIYISYIIITYIILYYSILYYYIIILLYYYIIILLYILLYYYIIILLYFIILYYIILYLYYIILYLLWLYICTYMHKPYM